MGLRQQFDTDASERSEILERARLAAALTDPSILPPDGSTHGDRLPETYQSVGSNGLITLSGLMLMSLFPITRPWFELVLPSDIRNNPELPPEVLQEAEQRLFLTGLVLNGVLESTGLQSGRRQVSFRSRMRMALDQLIVTGDVLMKLTDDYRLKVFNRLQYTTRRDAATDVVHHIIKEKVDPITLSDMQIDAVEIDREELRAKNASERMEDLYTKIEWDHEDNQWVITQEIRDKPLPNADGDAETREKVSPYFSVPFKLAPGDHYGRGYIEMGALGELRSLNQMELLRLEMLGMVAKQMVAVDHGSPTRLRDLEKESGSVIRALVRDGRVQDIAPISMANIADYQMLTSGIEDKTRKLSMTMMIESSIQPNKDRVTAFQVDRIARELDGRFGGLYTPVADGLQLPLLDRLLYQVSNDPSMDLPELPERFIRIQTLTGQTSLQREHEGNKLMTLAQAAQQLGPTIIARIDEQVFLNVFMRSQSLYHPGLVKSDERIQQEQQQAIQMAAAQQAIESTGAIAEKAAAQSAQQQGI